VLPLPTSKAYLLEARAFGRAREIIEKVHADPAKARAAEQASPPRRTAAKTGPDGGTGGVAVLGLYGMLEYGQSLLGWLMGGTDLRVFADQLQTALYAADVKAILLHVDSPGGGSEGVEETADLIRMARGSKPIVAAIDPMCASAAYWIASAADEIAITPSGEAGSIGVFCMHMDYSEALATEGVRPTIIRQPVNKAAGNPYEPLSDAATAWMQDLCDQLYDKFVAAVATGRDVSKATVEARFGGGLTLLADDAKQAGMVDRVEPVQVTMARLLGRVQGGKAGKRTSAAGSSEVLRLRHQLEKQRTRDALRRAGLYGAGIR
jgi:signal peptide peptidase SppA